MERTIEIELTVEEAADWFAGQNSIVQAAFLSRAAATLDKACVEKGSFVGTQYCYIGQALAEDDPALRGRHEAGRFMIDAIRNHMRHYITHPSPRVLWPGAHDPRTCDCTTIPCACSRPPKE